MFALKNRIENLVGMHYSQYQDEILVIETDKIITEEIISGKTVSITEDFLELYQSTYFLTKDVTKLRTTSRLFFLNEASQ